MWPFSKKPTHTIQVSASSRGLLRLDLLDKSDGSFLLVHSGRGLVSRADAKERAEAIKHGKFEIWFVEDV